MAIKSDPILGKERQKDIIRQLTTDPASPKSQDAWVLKSGGGDTLGVPYGLLLSLTQPGSPITYQFRYRTKEGTTISVALI